MKRRTFINHMGYAIPAAFLLPSCSNKEQQKEKAGDQDPPKLSVKTPNYLTGYTNLYSQDPKKAALQWFKEAKFGLFIHFGLYSQLGRGEWVMLQEKIPVKEYMKLKDSFNPSKFDADFITDLALEAGMKYINITTRHHDSFSLFETKASDFNSVDSPAQRDLIAELSAACDEKGLGFFGYYSYAADWTHPWFYPREAGWENARPAYETTPDRYQYEKPEDFKKYIDFTHQQLEEILTQYSPMAGIWLDPIMGFYKNPDAFPIEETYRLIRSFQPHTLISFKQGANGDEDFVAPEREPRAHTRGGEIAEIAWKRNKGKPIEICDTLQPRVWGYKEGVEHKTPEQVMGMLDHAEGVGANLLLNVGPLPDGSIHPDDVKTLRAVGKRLKS